MKTFVLLLSLVLAGCAVAPFNQNGRKDYVIGKVTVSVVDMRDTRGYLHAWVSDGLPVYSELPNPVLQDVTREAVELYTGCKVSSIMAYPKYKNAMVTVKCSEK